MSIVNGNFSMNAFVSWNTRVLVDIVLRYSNTSLELCTCVSACACVCV